MAGNGNSGRPRKSRANLKLHGTFRKDRHANRPDDSALPALAEKPAWLQPLASDFWDWQVAPLASAGVARDRDWAMAVGMCQWWAEWRTADSAHAMNLAWKNFAAAAAKFGLSPADRAKLETEPRVGKSDFEKAIGQHA